VTKQMQFDSGRNGGFGTSMSFGGDKNGGLGGVDLMQLLSGSQQSLDMFGGGPREGVSSGSQHPDMFGGGPREGVSSRGSTSLFGSFGSPPQLTTSKEGAKSNSSTTLNGPPGSPFGPPLKPPSKPNIIKSQLESDAACPAPGKYQCGLNAIEVCAPAKIWVSMPCSKGQKCRNEGDDYTCA
jgi:hypothetical protein